MAGHAPVQRSGDLWYGLVSMAGHAPVHCLYTDEPMSPLLPVGNLLAMSRFFSLARELLLWTGERSLVQINTTDYIGPKSLQTSKI